MNIVFSEKLCNLCLLWCCVLTDRISRICSFPLQHQTFLSASLKILTQHPFSWGNFKFRITGSPGFRWFCYSFLLDWPRKLALLSQSIKFKLKSIAPNWSPVFSRASGSSLAPPLNSHWLHMMLSFVLVGR